MSYWVWIPFVVVVLLISGWLSVMVNQTHQNSWTWWLWAYNALVTLLSPWPLISKHSKNLVFDSVLYDIIYLIVYTVAIVLFSNYGFTAKPQQLIGLLLIIAGFILMKI